MSVKQHLLVVVLCTWTLWLVAGCSGPQTADVPADPPPPSPRPFGQRINVEQKLDVFLLPPPGEPLFPVMDPDELAALLPPLAQERFLKAVEVKDTAFRSARDQQTCDGALGELDRIGQQLEGAFGAAGEPAKAAIALARIEVADLKRLVAVHRCGRVIIRGAPAYGLRPVDRGDGEHIDDDVARRVKALAPATTEVGFYGRIRLAQDHWRQAQVEEALGVLEEVAEAAPEGRRRKAILGVGLAVGVLGDHARAAKSFRDALATPLPPSTRRAFGASWSDEGLRALIMYSSYGAGQYQDSLGQALVLLASDAESTGAKWLGVPVVGVIPEVFLARRIAADCLERLGTGGDAALSGAPEPTRAGLLCDLAERALYRQDLVDARRHAEPAAELVHAGPRALRATKVLHAVAVAEGDTVEAATLNERLEELAHTLERSSFSTNRGWEGQVHAGAFDPGDHGSTVERRLRSLFRLCLEPHHIELGRREETEIGFRASVFDQGPAQVEVEWVAGAPIPLVTECLSEMGSRYFSTAVSSVDATVEVTP